MAGHQEHAPTDRIFTSEDEGRIRARIALEDMLREVVAENKTLPTLTSIELEPLVRRAHEIIDRLDQVAALSDEERTDLHAEYWDLATAIERLEPKWRAEQQDAREESRAGTRPSTSDSITIRPERNTLQ